MEITSLNAELLAKMFLGGAKNLEAKKEWINELNVFPVPDGDTGTNMSMTIESAAKEVASLADPNMTALSKAISSGSLRGARGNSGVILSQLFRGFCKVIKGKDEITVAIASEAAQKAVETAYKAVMKPKEGTILTVAKGAAEKAQELSTETEDFVYFLDEVIKHADYVLSQTPEMLPVLKQAGVVDSGGEGLMQVLKGAYDAMLGKDIDYDNEEAAEEEAVEEIRFGYSVEFLVVPEQPVAEEEVVSFKAYLESIGDHIEVKAENNIIRTSVYTNDPGLALQKALTYGALSKVAISNLHGEYDEASAPEAPAEEPVQEEKAPEPQEPKKEMGFIAVSIGDGLGEIFRGLGVDYIIEGGQTMNPSTEDMLNAIDHVNAEHIFILPNNKNIVMAANQAASICEDKDIIVIPTRTIPQGITALINYIADYSPEENKDTMIAEIANIKTGQVTYAVRDTEIDGKIIHKDDFMGIGDHAILSVGKDLTETTLEMIGEMVDEDSAVISIYYGSDSSEEAASALAALITEKYPDVEVEVNNGGQPIYYFMISVE